MTIITNNFNDVNNLIRLAYDFFYNQNKTLCYDVKPVTINDVDSYSSVKRILNSNQAYIFINSFLNDKIVFVKKYMTIYGNKYVFKKIDDPYSVNFTIFVYNTDEQNNLSSSQNMNKIFLKLFSDFLSYGQTKHITLQILNIDLQFVDFEEFIVNIPELKEFLDVSNAHNKVVSLGITEHFYKMISLNNFLTFELLNSWSDNEYKSLIFQIVHTLAVIQNKYQHFRHNNLNIKNMEGYSKTVNKSYDKYNFNGIDYQIPNIGFIYKMNNFESSIIIDTIVNEQIDENLRTINKFYDITTFLTSLKKHIDSLNLKLPDNTSKFIDKYLQIDHNNNGINTPSLLLKDVYFDSLQIISSINDENKKLSRNVNNKKIKKNNKLGIIENKISSQNLSEDMTPSFLFKGTRNNSKTNENKEINVETALVSGKNKKKHVKYTNDSVSENDIVSGVRYNNVNTTKDDDSLSLENIESLFGAETIINSSIPKKRNSLASALKASKSDMSTAYNKFPTNFDNTSSLVPNMNLINSSQMPNMMGAPINSGNIPVSSFTSGTPFDGNINMNSMPDMSQIQMQMPNIQMPHMHQMQMPNILMPNMQMPNIQMPQTQQLSGMAQLNGMQMPQINSMQMPQINSMQMPQLNSMQMPQINSMQMPQLNSMQMPQMDMYNMQQPSLYGTPQMDINQNVIKQYENWQNQNTFNGAMYGGNKDIDLFEVTDDKAMYGGNKDKDIDSLEDTENLLTFFFRHKINTSN
jgi:hypothetical protein